MSDFDNLDSFLESLGMSFREPEPQTTPSLPEAQVTPDEPVPQQQEEHDGSFITTNLSDDDISSIISDNGFNMGVTSDDGQEVTALDLDAEEDAAWENAVPVQPTVLQEPTPIPTNDIGIEPRTEPLQLDTDSLAQEDYSIHIDDTHLVDESLIQQLRDLQDRMLATSGVPEQLLANVPSGTASQYITQTLERQRRLQEEMQAANTSSEEAQPTDGDRTEILSELGTHVDNAVASMATPEPEETTLPTAEPLLPPNSPTLMLDDSTSRFSGTEWYNEIQTIPVMVAGLGGIGSWLALQLSRVNPRTLILYDGDDVDSSNMSGQAYNVDSIGEHKAYALQSLVKKANVHSVVYGRTQMFTSDTECTNVMMCGFDNMEARKTYFNAWSSYVATKPQEERHKCLYLDGRLSIDTLQVFCITGDNEGAMREYASKHLFDDSEADETICSLKQTTYMACMIGSIMVNLFTNFVANTLNPVIPYDLPFFTEYNSQFMIFKTES